MKVYIASDFHLAFSPSNQEEKDRNAIVMKFLSSLKGNADMLILAGDIFDLWYDWKGVIIKGYFPFLKILADLAEGGCRLVFVAGNHDFWFGNFLPDYLKCDIYHKDYVGIIDGKRIFVSHGDTYTSNDSRYRIFQFIIRHPVSRLIFSLFHPNISLYLGRFASRTSRSRNLQQTDNEMQRTQGLEAYANRIADSYDLIVMGHSHHPIKKIIKNSLYVNTGYWGSDNSYVRIIDGEVELVRYAGT